MSDETPYRDPTNAPEDLPPDLRAIDRRLASDVALWQTRLPATDRLNAHARALPQRLAATEAVPTPARTDRIERWEPEMQPTTSTTVAPRVSRARTLFAASATVVLVGLLAALFIGLSARGGIGPGSSSGGLIHRVGSDGDARYIASAVTARGVDSAFNAVDATQRFTVGETVYVVVRIQGIPKGEKHTLSIRWLLNAQDVNTAIGPDGRTSGTITGPSNLFFALAYPVAGTGIANLYWDTTPDQIATPTTDARVAATLKFIVAPAVATTPTATPMPTPTPTSSASGTPAPGPTPTPPIAPTPDPVRTPTLTPLPTPSPPTPA